MIVRTLAPLSRGTRRAAPAIEFSLVVLPFVALLFAIIETSHHILSRARRWKPSSPNSARLILTGQAQNGGFDQTAFKTAVCNNVHGLFDCANGVDVDVRTFTDFSVDQPDVAGRRPRQPREQLRLSAGRTRDRSSSCACSISSRSTCAVEPELVNMAGNKRLLIATAAFRNEPY